MSSRLRLLPLAALPLAAAVALSSGGACSSRPDEPGPCDTARVLKGPFTVAVTATGATVRWDAEGPGCSEVALLEGGGEQRVAGGSERFELVTDFRADDPLSQAFAEARGLELAPDLPGPVFMHEVKLEGLAPGSCHRYKVPAAKDGAVHRFCTLRPPGQPISLAVIGDTSAVLGDNKPLLQQIVAAEPDLVIHTGDLQYYPSVVETWSVWTRLMQPMFSAGGFFPCVGNHEFDKEAPTEFEDYYARFFRNPGAGTTRWYTFQSGGVHFFSLDTESPLAAGSPQHDWLVAALAAAKEAPGFRFSTLFFHRPIYTLGRHAPREDIRAVLEPLYAPNGVRLVLVGHQHVYERFEIGDVLSLTTGGGGAILYNANERVEQLPELAEQRRAGRSAFHWVKLEVDATHVRGRAFGTDGESFDTFAWPVP
jgi:acid phosphatase type 7